MSVLDNEPWKKQWQYDCIQEWKSKHLHGEYPAKIAGITNNERAFMWQIECSLKIETDALITAAHDHV